MLARHHDPIVAIATAPGRGAVGIVRVSGKAIAPLVERLCGKALKPREASYLPFKAADGQAIDQGLALYFPAPHSYTGEDVLELQAHGGPVVLQLLLARCLEAAQAEADSGKPLLPGLRLAEPGEFTERAFLNDKIDLAQAEAIADLIDASTEAAARSASRSLSGDFSREIRELRDALVHLRMLVEATLDFPEEEIDFLQKADAYGQLDRLQAQLGLVLARTQQGALLREGIKVVIAGQPNAGKSSLLNALAGAELAIVSSVAGTTRDVVAQTIQIQGVPLHVVDTAGLRDTDDQVERIGVERALKAIGEADRILLVVDSTAAESADPFALWPEFLDSRPAPERVTLIRNKADLSGEPVQLETCADGHVTLSLSAKSAEGLDMLREHLKACMGYEQTAESGFSARRRHLEALRQASGHLEHGRAQLTLAGAGELLAEDLRQAQQALGEITGAFSSDDLLGRIFSSFCIGK